MKRALFPFLVLLLSFPLTALAVPTVNIPNFVELSKDLKPSVVNISTAKTVTPRGQMPTNPHGFGGPGGDQMWEDFFNRFFQGEPSQPRKERSLGSGFIISKDGYILTNNHVVEDADEVKVTLLGGKTFTAEVKGLDPKLDLALVKIQPEGDLPAVELGDSEKLQVGEWVMAIGNPFGLEETVTVGIVSAKERVIGAGPYDNFIQTDASINPGNSGGPLFNMEGKVVGINTAIVAGGQGIGFAIPINAAKLILPQLIETGQVTRGWLGVAVQELTDELASSFGLKNTQGALVSDVTDGSPAATAGIQRGDIILAFNGTPIKQVSDLPRIVANTPVGEKVPVTIYRDGKKMDVTVEIGKLKEAESETKAQAGITESLGLAVSDITSEARRYYSIQADKGALVTSVDQTTPAGDSGIRPGDVIVEVNNQQIADAAAFRKIVSDAKQGQALRLLVQRGDNLFYTALVKQ